MLIAEFENGNYLPIGEPATIEEAKELWAFSAKKRAQNDEEYPVAVVFWQRNKVGQFEKTVLDTE